MLESRSSLPRNNFTPLGIDMRTPEQFVYYPNPTLRQIASIYLDQSSAAGIRDEMVPFAFHRTENNIKSL